MKRFILIPKANRSVFTFCLTVFIGLAVVLITDSFFQTAVAQNDRSSLADTVVSPDKTDKIYLSVIRDDFIAHKENVSLIYDIGMNIVQRIDSLFAEQRADTSDTELIRGIMVTRGYDRTILAYREILNGNYMSDPKLKLMIARHTALFEEYANVKREWDNQWDITARPVLYKHGLLSNPRMHSAAEPEKRYELYRDPEFRSVLWDRRMFAFDVSYITPALLESADEIINRIDELLSDCGVETQE